MSGGDKRMNGSRWIILTTSGQRTLPLVRSLQSIDIEAWTPTAQVRRRRPRSSKYRDVEVPVLATWVFAPYEHRGQLLAIQHSPVSDHPSFTVFQHGDVVPAVSDKDLQSLRDYEARLQAEWEAHLDALKRIDKKKRKRAAARAYVLGQRVKVEREAFAGLTAEIVQIRKSGDLVLSISGYRHDPVVPSCDVTAIHLDSGKPERAQAA